MSNVKGFTAAQMININAMIAAAVSEAVVTTIATMQAAQAVAPVAAPAAPKTLAEAKNGSFTMKADRMATFIVDSLGKGGHKLSDVMSTVEVMAVPAIVSSTGYVCAKSATTASAMGTKLSSWAERLAAARVAMEFAE